MSAPSREQVRRWRGYLADERAEAAVYRDLASRRTGPDRDILLELAEAEGRHEQHWLDLLGEAGERPTPVSPRTRVLGLLARRFGTVFVLALLWRRRTDDVNMRSAWVCSLNDVVGNAAVLAASAAVAITGSGWPDIIVGLLIAAMFAASAVTVIRSATRQLQTERQLAGAA